MSSISKGEDPSASYFSHARKASEDGKKAPSVQDRLFDKLFSSLIPELPQYDDSDELNDRMKDGRPQLSIPLLTWNFRRFSARIGVAFNFQWSIIRLVAWRRPTQTLSALSIYSFLCVTPEMDLANFRPQSISICCVASSVANGWAYGAGVYRSPSASAFRSSSIPNAISWSTTGASNAAASSSRNVTRFLNEHA